MIFARVRFYFFGINFDYVQVTLLSLRPMKHKIFLMLCLLVGAGSFAQSNSESAEVWLNQQEGRLNIHQDRKITNLMDTLLIVTPPLEGFRVQLSFGKKEEVNQIRVTFLQKYPELGAYVSYMQPNFRLRVGNFRTRMEAEKFRNEILSIHPNCYIVKDLIELPKLD
jgi:hypothetical protein